MTETKETIAVQRPELQTREKQAVAQETTRPGPVFRPDVDIVERANDFLVTADLPGTSGHHVDVRLEEGLLSIDATPSVAPEPSWAPVHAEYRVGSWHRQFVLPDRIDAERIHAEMKDGVLELVLPKLEQHRPRRVEVRGA
jgi:HSP20 family molecular chaperone IbpA